MHFLGTSNLFRLISDNTKSQQNSILPTTVDLTKIVSLNSGTEFTIDGEFVEGSCLLCNDCNQPECDYNCKSYND